jgi:acetyl esterase/lipase
MPSWQARTFATLTTLLVRRRDWGDARALTARARRLFGIAMPYGLLKSRGLRRERVTRAHFRGEWLVPPRASSGTILYLHGGGYVACSPATHRPITATLARLSGCRVVSVDYRRAPEHPFPAALDDAFAAWEWLIDSGVKPGSIAIAGDSAGGGLTLALLVRARDAGHAMPACAVCFSPWTDLAGTGASATANDGRCAMFHPENTAQFSAAYLGGASPRDPRASPLYADVRGLPPVLIQVGSTELLLDDARRMHERLKGAGVESQLDIFDDVMHCWQMLDGLMPEARIALRQAATFITTHIARAGQR